MNTDIETWLAAYRSTLAITEFEPLLGTVRLDGVPGSWSRRPDHAPGARVELPSGERLLLNGSPVEGVLDLGPTSTTPEVTVDGHRSVVVFLDPGDGVTWVGVADDRSPRMRAFRGIDSYPRDESWRLPVSYRPAGPTETFAPLKRSREGDEQDYQMPRAGYLTAEIDGESYDLEISLHGPERTPYINFRDATSGAESYAAGRFLVLPDALEDMTMIDLNDAFLPPCAYNPLISCPLPAPGSVISAKVRAGQRNIIWDPPVL